MLVQLAASITRHSRPAQRLEQRPAHGALAGPRCILTDQRATRCVRALDHRAGHLRSSAAWLAPCKRQLALGTGRRPGARHVHVLRQNHTLLVRRGGLGSKAKHANPRPASAQVGQRRARACLQVGERARALSPGDERVICVRARDTITAKLELVRQRWRRGHRRRTRADENLRGLA
jgi:hypothetical protein